MKTKLLLFLLFAFSLVNAQINVAESFETDFPTGWTTSASGTGFVRTQHPSYTCNGSYSMKASLNSSSWAMIVTPGYNSNGNSISLSYKYYPVNTAFNFGGNVYFYYEVNNSGTWNLITSSVVFTAGCNSITAVIPAGTIPNGSTVKFRMQVNSNSGGAGDFYLDNFIAYQAVSSSSLVAEYNFNNTYNNTNGNNPFQSSAFVSFDNDRNNNPNAALRTTAGIKATIPGLPTGISQRSVSIWYKVQTAVTENVLFVYGSNNGELAYGVSFNNANNWYNFAWNTNTPFTNPSNDGQWHHLVTTYDSSNNSKIYVDGDLITQLTQNGWSTSVNNYEFWLCSLFSPGSTSFNGYVDDLKIYNYALSQTEITNLFTNNTLSSQNFSQNNLEVSLYPNPATDVLNIEMTNEVKSIEIYSLQGQKVMTSTLKQINVSSLSKGMYLVKVTNADNNSASQKLIVK